MPPETVAWVGVGLTVFIQVLGAGFIYGSLSTKFNGLRREFDEHKNYPPTRGHASE